MKKVTKKLSLQTETISKLQSKDLLRIKGGLTSIGACCHSRNNPTDCATSGVGSCGGKEVD